MEGCLRFVMICSWFVFGLAEGGYDLFTYDLFMVWREFLVWVELCLIALSLVDLRLHLRKPHLLELGLFGPQWWRITLSR